jgi:signal peptidase I
LEPAGPSPVADGEGIALPAPREGVLRGSVWKALWDLLHDLSVAAVFCFFLVAFVGQAFRVQGTSMLPLLADGERIVVDKVTYRFRAVEHGDVVVFWYPRDPSVSFIKRIVGVPGDTVELRRGALFVNGREVREDYVDARYRDGESHPPVEVQRGFYYVLGDHRNSSNDSRTWGQVPERYIFGRALFRFWPLSHAGRVQ